ncbi:MAG TPA: hypothetical protein VK081_06315, partial [Planctomycetota bacterium]|nr:hypothetical protein [Planctomycetota bacterium]
SRDGEVAYFPAGTSTTRTEMDVYRVTDNGGTPLVTNFTRFAQQTGLAEFGFSAITPAATTDSPDGIKCAVSPDGTKLAVLAATTTNTVFPGLFVCTGAPNPALITVPGATYYSEVTFLSDTKVLFFAGPSRTAQDLYEYDVDAGAVTARTSVGDIVTRGQFWSLNKHWWYFIRSDAASTVNNIVAVSRKTGALKDITGNEFSAPSVPPRPVLHTGAIDTTNDPWPMLEMQIRRAPVGDFAYFAARRAVGGGAFEDANVFRFDIENGGQAEMLTNNTTTGPLSAIKQIESLTISRDGSHLAWAQRVGTSATSSEDVFHFHTSLRQMSASNPSGQTITDGSIWFTCDPPNGIVWSVGTGSTSVPLNSTRIQWAALSTSNPLPLTGPAVSNRFYQVLGTF